jgi:hypothetical protein
MEKVGCILMNQNTIDNPFTQCTARDMSYKEVLAYWCDPFNPYKLDETELFTSITPIFIEGARGSGKTMILKYISYYCQKDIALANNQTNLLEYFKDKNSLGVYLRYKEDFVNMFFSLACSNETKRMLFSYYFELLISREVIQIMNDLLVSCSLEKNSKICLSLINNFSEYFLKEFLSMEQLIDHINQQLMMLDQWVKNSRYYENSEEELIKIIKTGVISNAIKIIRNTVPQLKDILFLIIIDEYENAKEYQKNVNTYIKKVDNTEKITYRIGMRIEGMSRYDTDIGNEFIQVDRDYFLKKLIIIDNNTYKHFLKVISEKRLIASNFFNAYKITNIEAILGKSESVIDEALNVVHNSPYGPSKHFELIKKDLYKQALQKLRYPQNPLIEMLNIIWVLRGVSIEETQRQMEEYVTRKDKQNSKYKRDYIDKYKYQLVFILLNIYKRNQKLKKLYYSFNTFAFLSTGSVNDFISLCRNTFYQLDKSYYDYIEKEPMIPPVLQTNGAAKTALEQLGKIKANDENGLQMYTFVMNLGNWFSQFHKDPLAKYPETNQFAFENDADVESQLLPKQCLKSMLKWGALVKKQNMQSISIGRRKGSIYYLNHIFAPIFNISYRIRGGYNPVLPTELFEQILFNTMEPKDIEKYFANRKKNNIKRNYQKNYQKNNKLVQLSLFGEGIDDD